MFSGIDGIHLPIFESLAAGVSRDKKSDEEAFKMVAVDPERALDYMKCTYAGFVTSDFTRSQYQRFVKFLLEKHDKAVLWHCTAGKDRAGFASVIVQELLGVERAAIMEDYLKTNKYLQAEIQQLCEMTGRMLGGLDGTTERALEYLFGAHEEYLATVYSEITERYGGFDGFIKDGLGISDEERMSFRQLYIER